MKEKTSGQKMLLIAGFMAMATLLSKVLGLVRDSLLTAYFGSGLESDAFLTASTIPTTLFDVIIGGVISAAFIPVFNDIMSKRGKDEAMKFVNKFVTLIVCITLFIVVGGIIFRDVLVNIQAPNYTADKHNLAAQLTAIMFPMVIFTGLAFSFVGLLQSFGEYNKPCIEFGDYTLLCGIRQEVRYLRFVGNNGYCVELAVYNTNTLDKKIRSKVQA